MVFLVKSTVKALVGNYQLRSRMKQYLPADTKLSGEAVEVMAKTLNKIFDSVMASIGKLPYREFTGYVVSKESEKYFVQGDSLTKINRMLGEMKEKIEEWQKLLAEGKNE